MSELVTIARPYAKAAFDFAMEHQVVTRWQAALTFCAKVSLDEKMAGLLFGSVAPQKLAAIFIAVCGEKLDFTVQNFIRVMAENKRLIVLPDVLKQFIVLRRVQEAIVKVDIISIGPLKKKQLSKIRIAMEQRLSRKVKLNFKIDKSIIAGIIVRIDDMVIDGSVCGRLKRLASILNS